MSEPAAHKVVILGPSGVGKTSVVLQLQEKEFKRIVTPTVGSGVVTRDISTSKGIIPLRIWDTAGEERYRSFTGLYSQGASGCIVMFDISDLESFQTIEEWIKLFQENCQDGACIFLAGNKTDLIEKRQVSFEMASLCASKLGLKYYEVSAKTGENVDNLFSDLAQEVYHLKPFPVQRKEQNENSYCC